jgi:penicillin-binding protein 1C
MAHVHNKQRPGPARALWPRHCATGMLLVLLGHIPPLLAALPDFAQVRANWQSSEAYLLDRNGELLQELRVNQDIRRTRWTPLADISPALIAAVLKAEDQRFFQHAGVDWLAAGKAALTNLLHEKPRGASTLTMQLAGLLDSNYRGKDGRRDVAEKWRQMQAARVLEKSWRKVDILEAYINLAPFRGELTGIDAASRGLFDKHPAGLDDQEALILAALIRSPNAKAAAVARRACALSTANDCARLNARTFNVLSGRYPILPAADLAPHLARRLSPAASTSLRVSLDAALQRHARAVLAQQLRHLAARNARDAAALVVDNASGEVLAYVSLSSDASESAQNDGVRAPRQAGSTLKPFLYALAFEKRLLTAASPLLDEPLSIATGSGQYTPENYDRVFRGLVSARIALAGSLNIPAVRTLQLTGLDPFATRLAELGFAQLTEAAEHYGFALALGSLDVRLEELVNAYRSLANHGRVAALRFQPAQPRERTRRVMHPQATFLIGDILSDRLARARTFGLENPLATRYWSAVKTGTSKDMRDNWCIGYSPRYTVGVWVGNFDGSPMHDVSGISGAAPAWAAIMDMLHPSGETSESAYLSPSPPAGLVRRDIQSPGEPVRREWFISGTEPAAESWLAALPASSIIYPSRGMIFALDPDIPAASQQLVFRAANPPAGAVWQIDETRLPDAVWPLTRGRHQLKLLDAQGVMLDQLDFEVR